MLSMAEVYLGMGSNIEPREEYISRAVAALSTTPQVKVEAISDIIETEPWGFASESKFLNCVVKILVNNQITPQGLLETCKKIEAELGRKEKTEYTPDGCRIYHSRTIDIDILIYGHERINESNLVVPHPLMKERDFVMTPLKKVVSKEIREEYPEIFS